MKTCALLCSAALLLLLASACQDRSRPVTGDDAGPFDGGTIMGSDGGEDSGLPPDHCGNGVRDGDESHTDCGGSCMPCADGSRCGIPTDCQSGVCSGGFCLVPSCMDGVQNGDELAVDCGGGGCPGCPGGTPCTTADDCYSHVCESGACTFTSCEDMMMNSDETDVDCGGTICPGCEAGGACNVNEDCASLICDAGACTMATCSDTVQNQGESDVDCGGARCPACDPGRTCTTATDCTSRICDAMMRCTTPDCMDGAQNQDETDVDCGGAICGPCADGSMCTDAGDCESGVCMGGTCAPPSCTDGIRNGGESDTDCGGSTMCPRCADFQVCTVPADCTAAACTMGRCGSTGCIPFPGTSTDPYGYFGCSLTMPVASLPCPDIRTTGTALSLTDDSFQWVPIGFTFDFYGTAQTNAGVQSNGTLTFTNAYHGLSNVCAPDSSTTPYIAPYWDDLYPGTVRYQTVGSAPNRKFVAQWDIMRYPSTPNNAVFTVVLNEGSNDIQVCYLDAAYGSASYDGGLSATSSIHQSSTNALQFSCNTASLTDGLLLQYIHP